MNAKMLIGGALIAAGLVVILNGNQILAYVEQQRQANT